MRNRTNFFRQNMKTRPKRSKARNCISNKNVNFCSLDSAESIAQGIKILWKTTGGSKENLNSFGS